jgi:hypothetical protein
LKLFLIVTVGTGEHVEPVGLVSAKHAEVFEVFSSVYEEDDVDAEDDDKEKEEELDVVLDVTDGEVVGQRLFDALAKRFRLRRRRRHQPLADAATTTLLKFLCFGCVWGSLGYLIVWETVVIIGFSHNRKFGRGQLLPNGEIV